MSSQTWWYLARATGLVAWGLLTASVVSGLLLSTRLTRSRPPPAWILDLHRFLGGTAVLLTCLHLVGLVADSYVHFGVADLVVPYATSWEPGAVAFGIVALYLLVAVQGTSMLMRHLPRTWWRGIHATSYVAFWASTFHLQLAGTDASNPLVRWSADLAVVAVVFLTLVRVLSGRGRAGSGLRARSPHRTVVSQAGPA